MVTQKISDHRMIVRGAVIALGCTCWLLANLAIGQEAAPPAAPATSAAKTVPPSRKPRREEVGAPTIYYLKYADARSTAQTLAKVAEARELNASFVPETRLNAIIVQASPEVHNQVEQLIKELDVPAVSPGDQKDAKQDQEVRVQIYRLKYTGAEVAAQVLSTLCDGKDTRLAIDVQANSIVVSASPEIQQMVAQLIEKLDVLRERGADRELKIFRLKYAQPQETAAILSRISGKDDARIAVDARSNSILVEGSPDTLRRIEAILSKLDTAADKDAKKDAPGATLRVRVVWLASELPADEGVKPADDLKEVVGELSKVGVDGLRQLGQAIVNTTPDGKFQIRCSPLLAGRPSDLEISGILKLRQETAILNVQLSASQTEPAATGQGPPGPIRATTKRLVELGTTIAAPQGHYVVLGVTPVGKMTSVFILQVTAGKP